MTLIVAPADGFDSYVSVVDADAYVLKMGVDGWPATEDDKEKALRRATQYIRVFYAPKSKHLDPVHTNIKDATVEAAVRSLSADLLSDVEPSAIVREKIGPLETEFAEPQNGGQVRFALIDALMRGLGDLPRGNVMMLKRI
jgi:hypothetical protein